ncbi:MAG: hypothetical protein H0U70_05285 [Tatlockia sp.]|nr:hypothetical protein [Tatlockia sp.]
MKEKIEGRLDNIPAELWFAAFSAQKSKFSFLVALSLVNKALSALLAKPIKQLRQRFEIDQLALGCNHSFIRNTNGRIYGYGSHEFGQLGIGKKKVIQYDVNHPIRLANLNNIEQIFVGPHNSFFLNTHGQVFTCGLNNLGQLGIESNVNSDEPVLIPTLDDIKQISAALDYTLFLNTKGQVYACGNNEIGQLGIGHEKISLIRPELIPSLHNIKQIATGLNHSLFLDSEGQVFSCGNNHYGQLGVGNEKLKFQPAMVSQLKNIRQIAASDNFSCFLDSEGQVFCCGKNDITYSPILTKIENLNDIKQITCGSSHCLFLDTKGQVFGFGYNVYGQLGTKDYISFNAPIQIFPEKKIELIAARSTQSQFLDSEGKLFMCGWDGRSQLKSGFALNKPVEITSFRELHGSISNKREFFANPKVGLLKQKSAPLKNKNSLPPSNVQTLHQIVTTLIENIEVKKLGRESWFNGNIVSKLANLSTIANWISQQNDLDPGSQQVILSLVRDVCAIKRNTWGLFGTHSSSELATLLAKHKLQASDQISFNSSELSQLNSKETGIKLMEKSINRMQMNSVSVAF